MIKSEKTYPIVKWREYLDPNTSTRVKRFLKLKGNKIFTNLVETIEKAINSNTKKIVVLVHPNVTSLVIFDEDDYIEILTHIMFYFENIENYKMCSKVKQLIEIQRELQEINLNLEDGKQHHKGCTKG